jgi:hypothetical protein
MPRQRRQGHTALTRSVRAPAKSTSGAERAQLGQGGGGSGGDGPSAAKIHDLRCRAQDSRRPAAKASEVPAMRLSLHVDAAGVGTLLMNGPRTPSTP